ncbi:MAG: GNAT family N-acetyltransferase [Chloroflexi bacterium]|nr:GNAT family N-acetyltransferase [Chloroflexota bacterium]
MAHGWRIESASTADLPAVEALLADAGLPLDGVRAAFEGFLVARDGGGIAGAVGLERWGAVALFRSLVVSPARRGTGLGLALSKAAIDRARDAGIAELYLLTTTAADFFPRFGFVRIERDEAASAVRQSVEFTSACPQTATTMRLQLQPA